MLMLLKYPYDMWLKCCIGNKCAYEVVEAQKYLYPYVFEAPQDLLFQLIGPQ